jgi:N-acetylmuramoyl-L-alanine amidase
VRCRSASVFVSAMALLVAGCAVIEKKSAAIEWPPIVDVASWGGTAMDAAQSQRAKLHRITRITLHHGGVAFLRNSDPREYLRNLQTWSRNTRMWTDIPYHYLIDLDGSIYAGRDIRYAGDTNTQYDPTGHALIVVLGNFEEVAPNAAQLKAVSAMMAALAATYQVPLANIAGHKDYSPETACPGKSLYPYLASGYFRRQVEEQLQLAK